LILFITCIINKYNPIAATTCSVKGGTYKALKNSNGGIISRRCSLEYADGGNKCKSSNDCAGVCIVTDETVLRSTGNFEKEYVDGYGRCQMSNDEDYCMVGTIENPNTVCH
jgi:hypothetical protein